MGLGGEVGVVICEPTHGDYERQLCKLCRAKGVGQRGLKSPVRVLEKSWKCTRTRMACGPR